jgi:hypothetical protein
LLVRLISAITAFEDHKLACGYQVEEKDELIELHIPPDNSGFASHLITKTELINAPEELADRGTDEHSGPSYNKLTTRLDLSDRTETTEIPSSPSVPPLPARLITPLPKTVPNLLPSAPLYLPPPTIIKTENTWKAGDNVHKAGVETANIDSLVYFPRDNTYKLKKIHLHNRSLNILTQNRNGSSPLLAICILK